MRTSQTSQRLYLFDGVSVDCFSCKCSAAVADDEVKVLLFLCPPLSVKHRLSQAASQTGSLLTRCTSKHMKHGEANTQSEIWISVDGRVSVASGSGGEAQ